ncbi:hypothetical protein Dsin_008235 [Dipteronia sinensis]|uniref:Transmembrane protein n=1 Tax=Dipteronia sinensis TaxID=43782 RepID=A0AAE0AP01_9ROSI|nr:hypothetical protein Dsin_008235 [Dipteronia sinensis]
MKSLHFISLCMLTTFAFFFFIQNNIGSSAYSTNFHPRKQLLISSSNHKGPCHQFQCEMQVNDDNDDDDERKQSRVVGGDAAADKVDNDEETVYHIDYHGVTTHPNPTPKHPKP